MSEDTFGIFAEDFDPDYVQAQTAMMEHEAMQRGALSEDDGLLSFRVKQAFGFTTAKAMGVDQRDPA